MGAEKQVAGAISTLYKAHAERLFAEAVTYVRDKLNGGRVDLAWLGLTFGGVSRYGNLLAYYDPSSRMVVVPTDNPTMSIARFTADGIEARGNKLYAVLVHEAMHAADQSRDSADPHGTTGWVTQVAAMAKVECGVDIDPQALRTIMAFDRANHGAYDDVNEVAGLLTTADPTNIAQLTPDLVAAALKQIDQKAGRLVAKCERCGSEMIVRRKTKRFCSALCRATAYTDVPDDVAAARKQAIEDAKVAAKLAEIAALAQRIAVLDALAVTALANYKAGVVERREARALLQAALDTLRAGT